jgi:AraC family transcriptional activator FtrA
VPEALLRALRTAYDRGAVEPNVLYTDDGQILTSAGSAAGLDLCLHIVRTDHGTRIANTLARRLVAGSARRPGPRRCSGCVPSGSAARRTCSRTPTRPSSASPACAASARPQMRTHVTRINHVTPHAYQRTFRHLAGTPFIDGQGQRAALEDLGETLGQAERRR